MVYIDCLGVQVPELGFVDRCIIRDANFVVQGNFGQHTFSTANSRFAVISDLKFGLKQMLKNKHTDVQAKIHVALSKLNLVDSDAFESPLQEMY